nr:MAG TPA: Replication associated protein [Microviridae sp.]
MTVWCPCGKCEECVKDKQNEYVIRSIEEAMKVKGDVYFITLTYADDNITQTIDFDDMGEILEVDEETGEVIKCENMYNSLNNHDITAWKKRVKRNLQYHSGKWLNFSYLICGEYGPKTHRPHYHGLLMGLTPAEAHAFEEDWKINYGYTCFKKISKMDIAKVASYVAKYICKFKSLEDPLVMEKKVIKPRRISSEGYGMPSKKRWKAMKIDVMGEDYTIDQLNKMAHGNARKMIKVVNKISKSLKYKSDNGLCYKLPKYYRDRMLNYKDPLTGQNRKTYIHDLVTRTLVSNVQQDYSQKLCEMADRINAGENFEEMSRVASLVNDSEQDIRSRRQNAYIETNIAALRKSLF